jgi:XTP/dITP diphosphohydrolase
VVKRKICFATHNQNKVLELRKLLGDKLEILSLDDLGIAEEIEETGATLNKNALLKAEYVFNNYSITCFADDTGLEVDALNGAPGVYSARYAGEPVNNERNIDKLLSTLVGKSNRNAKFRTVISLVGIGSTQLFVGTVEGEIITERRGVNGFGYDSVFLPKNFDRTFAEMDMKEKNSISHRARAVAKLVDFLNKN